MRKLLCLAVLIASALPGMAFLDFLFDRNPTLIINTNLTEEGRKLPEASPKNPVYIAALSMGYEDFGRSLAGDTPPSEDLMKKILTKILKERGYLAASKAHPPTQLVTASWGTYYQSGGPSLAANGQLLRFMGGDKLDLMWEAQSSMAGGMLDPRVLLRGMRDGQSDLILSMAYGSVYLLSVKSFDLAAYQKNHSIVMLWETNIACPADGLAVSETLPIMVASAGPMLARETKRPEWVDDIDKHKVNISIGEAELVSYVDVPAGQESAPAPEKPKK
jgi:hypothetical protein